MLIKNFTRAIYAFFVIALLAPFTFSSTALSQQVEMGGFTGELTTTFTSGFATRLNDNNCRLIAGGALTSSRAAFADYVGYAKHNVNGGCNAKEVDAYGNTATKVQERINSNADDGKLNFQSGDLFDASQSLSFSYTGRNADGVSLNLSELSL